MEMEGGIFTGLGNGSQVDGKVLQTFQTNFVQVQDILDQNRLLINEINQNHESKIPDNLSRNVGLIRELNNNIRRVVDLYADLSSSFTKSMEASSEGESGGTLKSDGKTSQKRVRSGCKKKAQFASGDRKIIKITVHGPPSDFFHLDVELPQLCVSLLMLLLLSD
ncbi:protein ELF4-LIKE 4 isoform X1 [Ziziphus jujuba]|uniref:Protein ELF4-LIKE 4 isoform X1 n=3 Tax=Ziziphus jujuba TaxID=326968 RepID=A0ABM3I149_ZIZJJ|nr:protein ELF4-LIKE 4 isoform X1 [Ziziphus jujuba]XP_048318463.1 protein ELF4-LIKE 4 isoform X1 [Ziziphus jujuba]XP_048318471.1 protein ELF4-LIKE 4 isoform X1 [Ziziphus jujuba]